MKRNLAIFIMVAALLAVTGCSACGGVYPEPAEVVRAYEEAAEAGDIDACMELLDESIVIRQDPPGTWFEGLSYIKTLLEADALWEHEVEIITPYRTEGNIVSYTVIANGEDLAILGITDLTMRNSYMVEEGKITLICSTPDADEWAPVKENLKGGYGLQYQRIDDGFEITAVLKGSPVLAEGLAVGDVILAVDGIDCTGMHDSEIALRLFGPPGSDSTLKVRASGSGVIRDVTVTRVAFTSLG